MDSYDVVVIGGGASGMMAAGRAAELGKRVLLLEKNKELGKKLAITGGGRCNILNAEEDVHALLSMYGTSGKYLYSSFSQFGMRDSLRFFEERGLPLKVEARNRAFPQSEKASDVVRVMRSYLEKGAVQVRFSVREFEFALGEKRIESVSYNGETVRARSYIIAIGGNSHPETGSTGDGFTLLKTLGFVVQNPTPTIVPLRTKELWSHRLAGVTIADAKLSFYVDTKRVSAVRGPVLFTHFGLSGPTILNAAARVADMLHMGEVSLRIDTQPDTDLGILDKKIVDVFNAAKNKQFKNAFADIAPPGTAAHLLALLPNISPEMRVHSISREQRRSIAVLLKTMPLSVAGLMGFDRAVVADGGLDVNELDMRTFATRKYPNLFVIGDLLHIRRPSGGYSLQLAWTSGYVSGTHAC